MSWARRLKRVFGVQIESCAHCGGQLKIIASIEEPQLIAKIMLHLEHAAAQQSQSERGLQVRRVYQRPGGCPLTDDDTLGGYGDFVEVV
jgi:hypothetical protein